MSVTAMPEEEIRHSSYRPGVGCHLEKKTK